MLNFALASTDNTTVSKVTANTNGNHSGRLLKTGTWKGSDRINNVFDLEGNLCEWTQEDNNTNTRALRGGNTFNNYPCSPSEREASFPYLTSDRDGTRLSLYVK